MKNKLLLAFISSGLLLSGCNQATKTIATIKSSPKQNGTYSKVVYIPLSRYPETGEHVKEAEAKGKSSICTIDRKEVKAHRKLSLLGVKTKPGYDRDEFPMAMCKEGGAGADIKLVHSKDNRGEGSFVSHQLKGLPDGSRVLIQVK